jgi:diguanylate cyclase (GGDEF)-like protein/PAS domain S-box-containing protein
MQSEDGGMASSDASSVGSQELLRVLRKAVQTMQLGLTVTDLSGRIVYVNPAEARMHGYEPAELLGRDVSVLAPGMRLPRPGPAQLRQMTSWSRESVNRRRDGTLFPVQLLSDAVLDSAGEPIGIVTTCEDIGARKDAEDALRRAHDELEAKVVERTSALLEAMTALRVSETRYRLLFEQNLAAVYRTDLEDRILECNEAFSRMLGLATLEEALGRRLDELSDAPDVHQAFATRLKSAGSLENVELRLRRADGTPVWILENATLLGDPRSASTTILRTCVDITRRKAAEEQLLHDALHDALTGLPNRALFLERLRHAVSRARRQNARYAVLFLDLDRFKLVNDGLGHDAGDRLLVAIAERLRGCVRESDTFARFGGDEFTLLLEDVEGVSEATRTALRVQEELSRPFLVDGQDLFTTASVGIAVGDGATSSAEDLVRDADTAMYRAKALGKARYEVFDPAMRERAITMLEMETDLRHALERGELVVHYQPIVSLGDGKLLGFEALVRWQHPKKGLLLPLEFIPLAEETGLVSPLGRWVVDEACAALRRWRALGPSTRGLAMSVNVSSRQFGAPELVDQLAEILQKHEVPPGALTLEITESVLVDHGDAAASILETIRALGVGHALDDFGTGYSSLSYLHRLPLSNLKIDRSFVERIDTDPKKARIVSAIVELAGALQLEVIAEGVESPGQLARLVDARCARGQGFHFSAAVDASAVDEMLRDDGRVRLPRGNA